MSDVPVPSLDTATLEQIVLELGRRNTAVIVCGLRRPDSDADEGEFFLWRYGGVTLGFGLLDQARQMMLTINLAKKIDLDGDGE